MNETERPGKRLRPVPDDLETMVGKVMAGQVRVEKAVTEMRSAWDSVKREHSLLSSELYQLSRDVRDLREQEARTGRKVTFATRAAPGLFAIVEVLRVALSYYGGFQ